MSIRGFKQLGAFQGPMYVRGRTVPPATSKSADPQTPVENTHAIRGFKKLEARGRLHHQ